MDNRVQKCSVTLSCFSSDLQEVTITYTLNYQIDKDNAQELYKTVGMSYYDTVIAPTVAEEVKVETALHSAEELVGARAVLAGNIEQNLTNALAKYNINVVSAAIEDMDFTDAFTNAVEAKQVAAQNKLKAEIEQAQKVIEQEAAARRAVIDAEAAAEVARIQAQADLEVTKIQADAAEYAGQKEAAKNQAVSESLTEELLKYYYINQWNGVLPDTYVGSDDVSTIINGTKNSD
jgi:regulator of protease activity HflC (stomatin/prohibitin superfamily)